MNQAIKGFNSIAMLVVMAFTITTMKCTKTTGVEEEFSPGVSDDYYLKSLALSGNGTWNSGFDPQKLNYVYTVEDTVESITITPEANSRLSKIVINGKECRSNEMSESIPLKIGSTNVITIQVIAENKDVQLYTVIVERLTSEVKSDSNSLNSLVLSGNGSWDREFNPQVLNYTYKVPNTVDSVTFTPVANSEMSKITINGTACKSNEKSGPIPLKVGNNEIAVQVTAENGTVKKYAVMVERLAPGVKSDDNSLKSLALSGNGLLDPEFKPKVFIYTYKVPNAVDSITFRPEVNYGKSKITVNGTACMSKQKSAPIPLKVGKNEIVVQVTAENGAVQKYTVVVDRLAPGESKDDDAALISLTISGASLQPAFNPESLMYKASVSETKVPLDVTATARSAGATVSFKRDGEKVANPHDINFTGATATLVAEVTAEDGSTKRNYTIVVTKSAPPSKSSADLKGIEITFGEKNSKRPIYHSFKEPKKTTFDPAITNYAAVVYACTSITLTATADDPAVSSIIFNSGTDGTHTGGVKTGDVQLTAGVGLVTKVTISVTGKDGSTVKKYILEVKLLNSDEFFWGIYAPSFYKSYARWRKVVPNPGPGTDETIKGYVAGSLKWWVQVVFIRGKNNMKWINYCDGNDDRGSTPIYVPYNDNTGVNSQDGFVVNGATVGDVSLTGYGTQTGSYQLTTPWGDKIGSISVNYVVEAKEIVSATDSYSTFTYLGKKKRYNYKQDYKAVNPEPYPFTPEYDWNTPWKMDK